MENIFAVNNELTLDDYMKFDTKDRNHMGETLPIAVYRLMEFSIKEELTDKLGKEEQVQIFRGAGYRAGVFFAKNFLDISLSQDEFIAQLQKKLEELNIGILRIEKVEKENIVLTVAEDADCSGLPLLGETVCHYDEGFISGIFSIYLKKEYKALEVDCWATGDRVCRFQVELK